MIFGQNLVTCDDFSDYHEEIDVVDVDFINKRSICGHYQQREGVLLGTPNVNIYSRSSISLSMVAGRKNQGLELMNILPMLYLKMELQMLFSVQIRFGLVLECWMLRHI